MAEIAPSIGEIRESYEFAVRVYFRERATRIEHRESEFKKYRPTKVSYIIDPTNIERAYKKGMIKIRFEDKGEITIYQSSDHPRNGVFTRGNSRTVDYKQNYNFVVEDTAERFIRFNRIHPKTASKIRNQLPLEEAVKLWDNALKRLSELA